MRLINKKGEQLCILKCEGEVAVGMEIEGTERITRVQETEKRKNRRK
jgi:hypothetical protein